MAPTHRFIVGPAERLAKYRGRRFGSTEETAVAFGDPLQEAVGTIGQRALHAHPFTDDQLAAIRRALAEHGDIGVITIENAVPADWRHPNPHHLQGFDPPSQDLLAEVEHVSAQLLERLAANPEEFYGLTPRQFEEVIAELLHRNKYEVRLMPGSRDGGIDVIAQQRTGLLSTLLLVQCKRYAPEAKVGVGVVRQLYGVVEDKKASGGLIVTTSLFTRGAIREQAHYPHRMSLKDFEAVIRWVQRGEPN